MRCGERIAEAGFTLVEALVCTGLLAIAVMGFLLAVTTVLADMNAAKAEDALNVIAQNVLVDVSAATQYDQDMITTLNGRKSSFTVREPSSGGSSVPYAVTLSVAPGNAGEITARVHVSDPSGRSADASGILMQAAPAPGSTVLPAYMPVLPGRVP